MRAARNADRVLLVVFVVVVTVVGTAVTRWPYDVPSALFFPLVVASGLVLFGRALLLDRLEDPD